LTDRSTAGGLEVPSQGENDGVLAVRPGMIADTVSFAVE